MQRDAAHFLQSLFYERTNDSGIQKAFRKRRGLCNEHSWQATHMHGSSLSLAILFAAAFDEVLKIVETTPDDPVESPTGFAWVRGRQAASSLLADRLEPTGPCMVCDLIGDVEQRLIYTISIFIGDPKLKDAFEKSSGLCLPHFKMALRQTGDSHHREILIATHKVIWKQLYAELREFVDKQDYRRTHEPMGHEGNSWRRAAGHAAGEKGVFGVDPRFVEE